MDLVVSTYFCMLVPFPSSCAAAAKPKHLVEKLAAHPQNRWFRIVICAAMSLHSRISRSRGSARSSSESSVPTPSHSRAPSVMAIAASPSPKPPTAHYRSPSKTSMIDDHSVNENGGFEKKLKKMLTRVCSTSGGSVRSEFEQRLYHEMTAFVSSGASQCFDVSCRCDKSLVGASQEEGNANGLHMIHEHYSAQQNIAEKGDGGEFTFAEVMAANATLSVAEFSKVCQ